MPESTEIRENNDKPPPWKHWMRRLEISERFGIFADGKLVAIQEIRQRKLMLVQMAPGVEMKPVA